MLCLQSEAGPVLVHVTGFAGNRPVKEVSRVELQSRLRREDVEGPARVRLQHVDCAREAGSGPAQYEIVVEAAVVLELWVRLVDAGSDRRGSAKSNGVPPTVASSPVGISVESTSNRT